MVGGFKLIFLVVTSSQLYKVSLKTSSNNASWIHINFKQLQNLQGL